MKDVMKVIGTARLAADPELRSTNSGMSICNLRLAWSNSRKVNDEWTDVSSFIDMTVFGNQGEACSRYLSKGRQIVFEARLEQQSWDDKETGNKRYKHNLIADQVQFVGGADAAVVNGGQRASQQTDVPVSADDMNAPVAAGVDDDSIPF